MSQIFLFNLEYKELVSGDVGIVPNAVSSRLALRYFLLLFFIIALPIAFIIVVLVSFTGYSVAYLFPIEIGVAYALSAFFALRYYLKWRDLSEHGKIVYGEVIHSDTQAAFTLSAALTTRLYYRFQTPEQETLIQSVDLSYPTQRFPDGRKYPEVGARVAVLYARKKNNMLL